MVILCFRPTVVVQKKSYHTLKISFLWNITLFTIKISVETRKENFQCEQNTKKQNII